MTIKCVCCKKDFRTEEAFSLHMISQAHALRRLLDQVEIDRRIALSALKPTQSTPTSQKTSVPQTFPTSAQQSCVPCNRVFKNLFAFNQHLQNSKSHVANTLPPPQAQNLSSQTVSRQTNTSIPRQQKPSRVNVKASRACPAQALRPLGPTTSEQNDPWAAISGLDFQAMLGELASYCHPPEDLLKNRYPLSPYSAEDIAGLRKCKKCGRLAKKLQDSICYFHPGNQIAATKNSQRRFTCCQSASRGCTSAPHQFRKAPNADRYRAFASSPAASPREPKFRAITLDCEMAGVKGLRSEVILVCAVDYFTGAVLLNKLVCPGERVRDWRTGIHGITEAAMKAAVSQGQALAGWAEARAELWKIIDQDTILIGHALHYDLEVLRMVHTRIVDSAILAKNAVRTFKNEWGLQKLSNELLGMQIRDNKGGIHDCLEDVLATRAVVLCCVQNNAKLEAWAEAKRLQLTREKELREKRQKELARQKAESRKLEFGPSSDEEDEILRWSDIAEDLGWPHPDTGYDPWSD